MDGAKNKYCHFKRVAVRMCAVSTSCVREFIGESYKIMLLLPFMHTIKGQLKATGVWYPSFLHHHCHPAQSMTQLKRDTYTVG